MKKVAKLNRLLPVFVILFAINWVCGGSLSDYTQTVKSGISILPWPKQIEALYGDSDHFITHYGFDDKAKPWTTEVYFGGRYRLAMEVNVDVDYDKHLVKTNGSAPKFYLFEVKSLERGSDGRMSTAYYSGQWVFDEKKWLALIQARGDWSVIGIPVKTNSPITGFDEYVKEWRSPRIKIPH